MTEAEIYTIVSGDNLSAIARKHGLTSWQLLYYAPENEAFRKRHPNPDLVHPGVKIRIPPDSAARVKQLKARLSHLRRLRADILQFGEKGKREIDASARTVNSTGATVDAVATVATLFVDLGGLLKKGFAWNVASGAAKRRLNDEIVRGAKIGFAKKHRDAAAIIISSGEPGSSSVVWLATQAVAQAWCDITSPSFWANTASRLNVNPIDPGTWKNLAKVNWSSWSDSVTTKPEDVSRQAREKWNRFIRSSLLRIDRQIREVEMALRPA